MPPISDEALSGRIGQTNPRGRKCEIENGLDADFLITVWFEQLKLRTCTFSPHKLPSLHTLPMTLCSSRHHHLHRIITSIHTASVRDLPRRLISTATATEEKQSSTSEGRDVWKNGMISEHGKCFKLHGRYLTGCRTYRSISRRTGRGARCGAKDWGSQAFGSRVGRVIEHYCILRIATITIDRSPAHRSTQSAQSYQRIARKLDDGAPEETAAESIR